MNLSACLVASGSVMAGARGADNFTAGAGRAARWSRAGLPPQVIASTLGGRMFGLRVRLPGEPEISLALPHDQYLVSAAAHVHRRLHAKRANWYFQGSGIDDRDDHLGWFLASQVDVGFVMDVAVVDLPTWTVPRRKRRTEIDWHAMMTRARESDRQRVAMLESRLARLRSGLPLEPSGPEDPPTVAFRLLLNGRSLGSVSVNEPGALTVTVYAKRRAAKETAILDIHGGTQLDESTWRWYRWAWAPRPLDLGDRVRIQLVHPKRSKPNVVRGLDGPPATPAGILAELRALKHRLRSNYYASEEMAMGAVERPAPRSYPRR
jgi:hypothetical protein